MLLQHTYSIYKKCQRRYRASGSEELMSMERGACERRASKLKNIGNSYFQFFFCNFVGEKEEKSLILTYYRVSYNCGLYGNLFLIGEQLYHLPVFFLDVVKAKHHQQTKIHPQILLRGNSITHHISFRRGCKSQPALVNTNSSTNFAV